MSRNTIKINSQEPPRQLSGQRKTRCQVGGVALIVCLVVSITCIPPTLATPRAVDAPVNQFTITPNQGTRGKTSQVIVRSIKCDQKLAGATLKSPDGSGIDILTGNTTEGDCAIKASISIKPDVPYGQVVLQLLSGSALLGSVTFTVAPPQYLMIPGRGVPGKEYDVTVSSSDCAQNSLKGAVLATPQGSGINVSKLNSNLDQGCSLTAKISIEPDAPYGDVAFRLTDPKGEIFGLVPFSVISKPPEPIPPGIDPQIDLMWAVVPWKVVADNFGRRIAKLYYCVEVIIGNNSGYSLQIVSTGFTIPKLAQQFQGKKPIIPSNGYKTTRGSIEWEQNAGWRNLTVNLIKGLGPVLTGFTPFFHAVNHRANYSEGINVLSSPFEKGFELVFPDKTIRNLERLDDQVLRDGLIINNNLQVKTKVFMPKDMVGLSAKEGRDDPWKVMLALGELVIVGDRIQHINRVKVTSSNEGGPVAPPPTVTPDTKTLKQGETNRELIYSGTSLEEASVTCSERAELFDKFEFTHDEGGHSVKIKVDVKSDAKPGIHFFNIDAGKGVSRRQTQMPFIIEAADIEASLSDDSEKPVARLNGAQDAKIKIKGKFLKGADVKAEGAPGVTVSVDKTTNEQIDATVHIPEGVQGDLELVVSNNNKVKKIPFSIGKQALPTSTSLVVDPSTPNVTKLEKKTEFKIAIVGKNLNGADLVPTGEAQTNDLKAKIDRGNSNDEKLAVTITVPKNTTAQTYEFELTNTGGKAVKQVAVAVTKQAPPEVTKLDFDNNQPPLPGEEAGIVITGSNLDGAVVEPVGEAQGKLTVTVTKTSDKEIKAKVQVGNIEATTYKLQVRNTGKTKDLDFVLRKPNPQ